MSDAEPTTFSFRSTKRLIQMVQERPCLWDKNRIEYKDRLAREQAWVEIFEQLDPSYKTANATLKHEISVSITKKWYNIRDSYVKSMKPDYLGRRSRPYIHSDLLRFLDDRYYKKIQKCREVMSKSDTQDEDEMEENETESWDHEVFVNIDETDENTSKRLKIDAGDCLVLDENASKRLKIDGDDSNKDNEDIVAVLTNLIRKEEDEDRAFFKSITPSVKTLSEDSKLTFRIEVLKLIKKLKFKERGGVNLKSERISNNDSESE